MASARDPSQGSQRMSKPRLGHFYGGLKLAGHKDMSMHMGDNPTPLPARLVLPLQQHIGSAAEPIVEVGDRVLKGQCIAQAQSGISVPLHAPSSGIIESIEAMPSSIITPTSGSTM